MKKSQLVNLFSVVFLLLIFSAFSSSAWGAPTHACGGIHTWHDGNKDYYLEDHKCDFFGSESINNKDLGTITSSSFGIDFVIYNNDGNNTYNNGLVGYQIDDAAGEWPTLTLERNGDYGYNGTNYAKYKVYLNISALNLSNGQHTIKFYYRVPHVNNDWYINNSNNNYSFTFTLAGESSEDEDIDVPEMPDGLVCDSNYRKVLFFEDFGVLEKETSRKQNNTVDEKEFVTSYNFVAECKSIKNAGDYAIITNPTWSGCTATSNNSDFGDPCFCEDKEGVRLWYKNCLDHTEGDGNLGGMLQFDCRNGNSSDILYQRTLSNVCENTFLNFSAWVTKANSSNVDPIKARFLLRKGGGNGEIIGKKDVVDINLNEGWNQISAMFNTGDLDDAGQITVQLINLAPYGKNGNDILLDDLELAACAPKANLSIEGGGIEKTLDYSENLSEILEAKITDGIIDTPYFYWQSRSKTQVSSWSEWLELHDKNGLPVSGVSSNKIKVTLESPHTEYRVIIVPSENHEDNIRKVLENLQNDIPCGMFATTNVVTLNVAKLPITFTTHPSGDEVCVGDLFTFNVTATGAEYYQWQKSTDNTNWTDISGKTGISYEITTAISDNNTYYRVKATNTSGTTAYSNSAKLTVYAKPSLSVAGDNQTKCNNGTFTLAATAPSVGTGSWTVESGTAAIQTTTSATSQVTGVPLNSSATLKWTISNGVCTANSSSVVLTNNNCTTLNIHAGTAPVVCDGAEATFTFTLTNAPVKNTNVTSTITLGTGLSDAEITPSKGAVVGSTWTISEMEASEIVTLTIKAKATTDNPIASVVVNSASSVAVTGVQVSQSATVNTLPTAVFSAISSDLCASVNELTNAQVTLTGSPNFTLTYKVDNDSPIEKTVSTLSYTIQEQLGSDATISLVSVKDANGCEATISDQLHNVSVDNIPTIGDITVSPICAGSTLSLSAPTVTDNGSTLGNASWTLNGSAFDVNSTLDVNQDNQPLKYAVKYTCGRQEMTTVYSNPVNIEVDAKPSLSVAGGNQTKCNNGTFTLAATAPSVGTGSWTVESGTAAIQTTTSATSQVTGVPLNSSATLKWTISNGVCTANSSSVVLTNNNCTTLNIHAGTAPVVCDGAEATFTFTLTNAPVKNTNVTSTITLGTGLSDAEITPSKGAVVGSTWTISEMEASEIVTLTIKAKATTDNPIASVVVNSASSVAVTGVQVSQSATVNTLPTAVFSAISSDLCASVNELTNAQVTLTGSPNFTLTYKVDNDSPIEKTVSTLSYTIQEQLGSDATISLVSVKDANGCEATISDQLHNVSVDNIPTIGDITVSPICAGSTLSLSAPTVTDNGSTLGNASWTLNGSAFDVNSTLDVNQDNQPLKYAVKYTCGRQEMTTVYSNPVNIEVDAKPSLSVAGGNQTKCNNGTFTLAATAPSVGTGSWTVESGTAAIQTTTSATSQVTGVPLNSSATLKWTISNGVCTANSSSVVLTNNNCTTLNIHAGTAPVVCDGAEATFTFTLTNAPVKNTNVTSTITLGTGLSDAEITPSKGAVVGSTWTISEMEASEIVTLTIKAKATTDNPIASVVVNSASSVAVTGVQVSQSATVNTLPTAVFSAISSDLCASVNELTNAQVTLTGSPNFTLTYKVDNDSPIEKTVSTLSYTIQEQLGSDATISLVSVKDANGCEATISDQLHNVSVDNIPTIGDITVSPICEGSTLSLSAPTVTDKGSTLGDKSWLLDGSVFDVNSTLNADQDQQSLKYAVEYTCGRQEKTIAYSKPVKIEVEPNPVVTLDATDVILNCTTPTATVTASGASTYEWSYLDQTGATQTKSGATLALQQTDPDVSSLVTEYTVYGYSKNANCKSEEAKTVKVTEDFVKPVVDIKISETADGTIPERLDCYQQNIKLEADLTNNKETIVEYIWSSGSDNNTTLINNPGTYTLQVKGENGCISDVATETIEQNIVKPEVSIESYITDPVTGNIIPTVELTCANNEITLEGTITNADQYAEDYPNGEFTYLWSDGSTTSSTVAKTPLATSPMEYTLIVTSPNGCLNEVDKAKVTVTENVSAPVLNIESVYKLCPSDTLSVKALSSLLPKTAGVTYKFYDEAGVEIDDFYGVSSENPVSTYYVVGTSENGCSSEKVSFDVDFAKNVDFTLTTSQTSMLVGGNETLVTIVPNEDSEVADTYTWLSNGKDILVEGLEYSTNLYLDTKFEVTATNRCDSKSQEAFVEVLWPTAFTPHNGNGKNDDFAKGMHIIVFNRFYTKIFEGPDGWDGTINGAMNESESIAVPGVYYYSVQLPNGEVKKGTIEIVKVD